MRRLALALVAPATLLALTGCPTPYEIRNGDLDSGLVSDASIKADLVSVTVPAPTAQQKATPVVIAVHGFTATPFEMQDAATYLRGQGLLVSKVLLGGHGTSLSKFEQATWKDWQAPILDEYKALKAKGYQKITFLTVSTGGTLVLEALSRDAFSPQPPRIVMLSPIAEFKDKRAGYLVPLSWLGVSAAQKVSGTGLGHWYRNRPVSTIASLIDLTEIVKDRLRKRIVLASSTDVLILQPKGDQTVDPVSAPLIDEGLKGGVHKVEMIESDLHVPIRPDGVDDHTYTPAELATKQMLLEKILQHLTS
ncbi:hypothetical protein J7643_13180 [bacterium]|nr:hypothetical protein [bacterium]